MQTNSRIFTNPITDKEERKEMNGETAAFIFFFILFLALLLFVFTDTTEQNKEKLREFDEATVIFKW